MKSNLNPVKEAIIRILMAFAGSVLIGYIVFQSAIFEPKVFPFQFISGGFIAAFFYTLLILISPKNSLFAFVIFCILVEIFYFQYTYILRDVLYFASLGLSVYIYWRITLPNTDILWYRPLLLAGLFAVIMSIITFSHLVYSNALIQYQQALFTNLSMSFLVGLGSGIGIEAGNFIVNRFNAEAKYNETGSKEE